MQLLLAAVAAVVRAVSWARRAVDESTGTDGLTLGTAIVACVQATPLLVCSVVFAKSALSFGHDDFLFVLALVLVPVAIFVVMVGVLAQAGSIALAAWLLTDDGRAPWIAVAAGVFGAIVAGLLWSGPYVWLPRATAATSVVLTVGAGCLAARRRSL